MPEDSGDNAEEQEQQPSVPVEKTPISSLQEWCTKHNLTPQYDLVANEGAVHEPLFIFKVRAGDLVCTGKGPSKKKAKHNAAVAALSQLMICDADSAVVDPSASSSGTSVRNSAVRVGVTDDGQAGNPVGELQEMTQKRMWPPPVYDFTAEQGPPHAREFVCVVKLFSVVEQAVGKSKKLAKRNAAIAMLQLIKQGFVNPKVVSSSERSPDDLNDESGQLPPELSQSYLDPNTDRNSTQSSSLPAERKKISAMFQPVNRSTKSRGKILESLQSQCLINVSASPAHCQTLEELAVEQKLTVKYRDLKSIVTPGCISPHICLVELSSVPVTVCCGSGPDQLQAHATAALNALNYLKVMTKKS